VRDSNAISFNMTRANQLVFYNQSQVIQAASEHRAQFADATHPMLRELLRKVQLSFSDAIALLTCDQTLFLTPQQVADRDYQQWRQTVLAAVRRISDSADPETLETLLKQSPQKVIEDALAYK